MTQLSWTEPSRANEAAPHPLSHACMKHVWDEEGENYAAGASSRRSDVHYPCPRILAGLPHRCAVRSLSAPWHFREPQPLPFQLLPSQPQHNEIVRYKASSVRWEIISWSR